MSNFRYTREPFLSTTYHTRLGARGKRGRDVGVGGGPDVRKTSTWPGAQAFHMALSGCGAGRIGGLFVIWLQLKTLRAARATPERNGR